VTAYQELRRRGRAPRASRLPADVQGARNRERTRRAMEAQRRTAAVMRDRHLAEWRAVYAEELAGVQAERGPLPGDDEPGAPAQHLRADSA
jgi:hypothetical protein